MVTTKKIKSKAKVKPKWHWTNKNWDFGAVIVALFGTFLLLVSLLSRPQIVILHHTVVITQGVVAPAIIMGAIVWSIVELFTPPGKTIEDLLVRIVPAFVIGGLIGGFLGYEYNFGTYVIRPAMSGNVDAVFFLISVLIASIAVTWNAAWQHMHGFRGQRGRRSHLLHSDESGSSKGARGMIALLIIFIAFLLIVPIGAAVGNAFVAGHDNSQVLQSESQTVYISSSSGPVPFGSVNGTATFDFPSTTSNNVTTYSHTVYIKTDLTIAELNDFAVSKIVLGTNVKNFTAVMGTGNASKSFVPILSETSGNSTSLAMHISPELLTGVQSSPVVFEINANTTAMSLAIHTYGNNGQVTVFGPYQVMQFTYLLGGVVLLASAFFSLSMYDMPVNMARGSIKKAVGGGRK